jgi:hypothetical protein
MARMEPSGLAFGEPKDRLHGMRGQWSRMRCASCGYPASNGQAPQINVSAQQLGVRTRG